MDDETWRPEFAAKRLPSGWYAPMVRLSRRSGDDSRLANITYEGRYETEAEATTAAQRHYKDSSGSSQAVSEASTVLLLDGIPDFMDAVSLWLATEGWRPLCAKSIEEALSYLERESIDAIIMEPHLRIGSAIEVAVAARRRFSDGIVIVALTTSGRKGDETAYEPTLFDANLVKPVSLEQIALALRAPGAG